MFGISGDIGIWTLKRELNLSFWLDLGGRDRNIDSRDSTFDISKGIKEVWRPRM